MYEDWDEEYFEEEYPTSRAAERRKNDWKFAKRHAQILIDQDYELDKSLHYYSKTRPEFYYQRCNKTNNKGKHRTAYGNYNPAKNWNERDKRQIENLENQLDELFDSE